MAYQTIYERLEGRRFRPTFNSTISYFKVRGYDKERGMVLTTAYLNVGGAFNDEISHYDLVAGFDNGDYELLPTLPDTEPPTYTLTNPRVPSHPDPVLPRFDGPCCNRCQHRNGTTSNRAWCYGHYQDKKCYRFKLEK